MKSVFLVFALIAIAFAFEDPDLNFNTTATAAFANKTDFPDRNCTIEQVDLRGIKYNAYYATCNSVQGSNSVIGSGMLIGNATGDEYSFFIPPCAFGFEYTEKNELSYTDLARLIYYKKNPDNYLFKTLIALTLPGVVELDKQGRYVSYVSFNTSGKEGANTWSSFTPVKTNEPRLKAFSSKMKGPNNAEFRVTMILSSAPGVLNFGYVPVSPNTVNYVVEIENWPYKSEIYRLGLIVGSAIKINAGHFDDNYTTRVDDSKKVLSYIGMPGYAIVDKKIVSINTVPDAASIIRRTPLVVSSDAVELMEYFLFEDKGYYKFRAAVFPESAKSIVYGMSVGAGSPIYSHIDVPAGTYSAASSVILSIVAVLVALALVF